MFGVVVGEFCQWQKVGPVGLLVVCIDAEVLFQHRVQPLRLPVRMGVECRGAVGPNAAHVRGDEMEETHLAYEDKQVHKRTENGNGNDVQ